MVNGIANDMPVVRPATVMVYVPEGAYALGVKPWLNEPSVPAEPVEWWSRRTHGVDQVDDDRLQAAEAGAADGDGPPAFPCAALASALTEPTVKGCDVLVPSAPERASAYVPVRVPSSGTATRRAEIRPTPPVGSAVTCVSVTTVDPANQRIETMVSGVKLVPVMVTVAPGLPEVGEMPIEGVCRCNVAWAVAPDVPPSASMSLAEPTDGGTEKRAE